MQDDVGAFLRLVGQSIQDPANAAKVVLSHRYDRTTLWLLLLAVTAAGSVIPGLVDLIGSGQASMTFPGMSPITFALMQGCFAVISAFALYFGGQAMGGKGHFPESLMVVIWLAVIGIVFQTVQAASLLIGLEQLMSLITIGAFGWQLFIFCHFVNVLHGFDSLLKSFGLLILISIGIVFGLGFILTMVGVTLPAGGV